MDRRILSKQNQRVSQLRAKRRFITLIIIVSILYILLIVFSHLKKMHLTEVSIQGLDVINEEEFKQLVVEEHDKRILGFIRRDHPWFLRRSQLIKHILIAFPRIATVDVKIEKPYIHYTVVERIPTIVLCNHETSREFLSQAEPGQCWYVDENSIVFAEAPLFSSGVYTTYFADLEEKNLKIPFNMYEQMNVDDLPLFISELLERYDTKVIGIRTSGEDVLLDIETLFGSEVMMGSYLLCDKRELADLSNHENVWERISALQEKTELPDLLIEKPQKFEYLDIRFDDKAVYKFKE